MPRTCTVCQHPKRKGIESAHLSGQSFRFIAAREGVSKQAITRHVKSHMPEQMVKAAERKEIAAGASLIERLVELNKISRKILADAYRDGDRGVALQAITRLEKQLELEARLLGEIRDNQVNVVNVSLAPEAAERIAAVYLRRRGMTVDEDSEPVEAVAVEDKP